MALDLSATPREQTRARYPDQSGYVERDGIRIHYEVYGSGEPTILFLPTWSIIHSRCWKMQVPYLARHCRVITFDPRGNGASDRPEEPEAYAEAEFAADALEVLDATATERAVVVGFSMGAQRALLLAANHPERVEGAVFIGPALPLGASTPRARAVTSFDEEHETYEGWHKYNRRYWLEHYADFLEFFFSQVFTEPHSTKQIEDVIGWALETDGQTLAAADRALECSDGSATRRLAARLACPVLVIHGTDDAVRGYYEGEELARCTGGTLVTLAGSGHFPHARDPVRVNMLIKQFADGFRR
jgi:pimeloyl-ACP methyl ester carboxylesterase